MLARRSILTWLSIIAFALTGGYAIAHTNEYLDTLEGEHGGQLRMSGAYHFELVATSGELKVYVTDHAWKPIDTAGAEANAMVITNEKKTVIQLRPGGTNTFEGNGDFSLDEHSTVHLKVVMPSGDAELATFVPLKKRDTKPAGEEHHDHRKHH